MENKISLDEKTLTFVLFSNCIPVRGAMRSVILDLQRESMFYITNDLYDILQELKSGTYHQLIDQYEIEDVPVIEKYLNFLDENDLGFWTEEANRFPELNLDYHSPSIITNSIIDVNRNSRHNWRSLFSQLEELGCRDIQLRFYDFIPLSEISGILSLLEVSTIKSVELVVKYDNTFTKSSIRNFTNGFFRIKTLTVHSSPWDEIYLMNKGEVRSGMGNIIFVKQNIDSSQHCGQISPLYFSFTAISTITEAYNHNSCLNRKLSIDHNGDIKNCPTLPSTYGNANNDTLSAAITPEFMKYWNLSKDQINICKVCEYRYVCTDCRAFLENDKEKPLKCTYDPYTLKWN